MENIYIAILVVTVSLVVSLVVYPLVLHFAKAHDIMDNPNARKQQRVPVPVMGGVVVYAGIIAGGVVLSLFMQSEVMAWGLLGMTVMMLVGIWDDMKDLSATLRLIIEIALVSLFIAMTDVYIDDLHGLWGIHDLDPWAGVPLSVVVGVGIINAINLIDGVDGYSSGYGMFSCGCFAIAFWSVWSPLMVCMALMVIASLIPFFLHNVFGVRSKMFIGDGGTLMLGVVLTVLTFCALSGSSHCDRMENDGISLSAFTLAVGCIPIFDTLRVMIMRMLRGHSPFKPDKTHLHHLFIDMGFSHLGAALFILLINTMVILIWLCSWRMGVSIDIQTYIVIGLGIVVTFGFYKYMRQQQNGGPIDEEGHPQGTSLWQAMCRLGEFTHREKKHFWQVMRRLMDGPLSGSVGG